MVQNKVEKINQKMLIQIRFNKFSIKMLQEKGYTQLEHHSLNRIKIFLKPAKKLKLELITLMEVICPMMIVQTQKMSAITTNQIKAQLKFTIY